ncbi:alpha/beta hydrolase family protein [Nocardioides pacificus]
MSSDPQIIRYGEDPSQYGELYRPAGASRGVVVLVHGGSWKAAYGLDLTQPAARDLAGRGWTVWNVEYRRIGSGGDFPAMFDDVAAAIDTLADIKDLDLTRVVAVGHSAGGHLATWAAARGRFPRWPARVELTGVVALAALLDLEWAAGDDSVVDALVGDASYDEVDPLRQAPLAVPVWCVHSRDDESVPFALSTRYDERSRAAGGVVEVVEVPGDHMAVIDVDHPAWAATVEILDAL